MMIVTGDGRQAQRLADTRLGGAIRARRRERGLTLIQLAAATGLSQPFLSQVELGRSRPSMRSLFRIAEAMGTTQQALLGSAAPVAPVPIAGGTGGGRLLLHDPGGADVTEFADLAPQFAEFYAHPRHELLYVVLGTIELELGGDEPDRTRLGPRESVGYSGLVPHRFRRVGEDPCVVVMVHSGA
jgi:transcriptional regulator with XRE-family HTH domain